MTLKPPATNDDLPHHLMPIEPAEIVNGICRKILDQPSVPYHVRLETEAFRETRTRHDGRRLWNAIVRLPGYELLAADLQALLAACPRCAGTEWVCENHKNKPWSESIEGGCTCGAGAPCPECNDLATIKGSVR